jgi:hypothetical protein
MSKAFGCSRAIQGGMLMSSFFARISFGPVGVEMRSSTPFGLRVDRRTVEERRRLCAWSNSL